MNKIFEEWYNSTLFCFIKNNKKVTMKQIEEKFPIKEGIINSNNLIKDDLKQLISMGKIKYENGHYSIVEY